MKYPLRRAPNGQFLQDNNCGEGPSARRHHELAHTAVDQHGVVAPRVFQNDAPEDRQAMMHLLSEFDNEVLASRAAG